MKKDKALETNDNLSNISPIKEGPSHSNSKSIFKFGRDDDLYSNNNDDEEDKDDLLSLSSEDIETKMNRLINIKKRNNNVRKSRKESKKEMESVNKFLRTSMQKKTTKFLQSPINAANININKINEESKNRPEEKKEKNLEEKKMDENNIRKFNLKQKN